MPEMHIILEGDGALNDWQGKIEETKNPIRVMAMESGMVSGDPAVAFGFELDDGRKILAQTSLRLFLTAADAFKARYGDPRLGEFGGGKTVLGGHS